MGNEQIEAIKQLADILLYGKMIPTPRVEAKTLRVKIANPRVKATSPRGDKLPKKTTLSIQTLNQRQKNKIRKSTSTTQIQYKRKNKYRNGSHRHSHIKTTHIILHIHTDGS